ncbi:Imm1 family immunity protein [Polyangium jinanense]|uniref:Uncharacterized protein n=1 Tax=Polyangium jinanense TaxID=2829994 RepID=A0A9X3XA71_9BACT|nr:Imm1 family immunity protein [Polyangium jinanense]MDC3957501.1 hypothetical protein [Polyangium jinanense]MDC3985008.1 hypothetical protein [Polyangium jinanense]
MSITFRDEQDENNPRNGSTVQNPSDLDEVFMSAARRPPFFFSLTSHDSHLLVGVGRGIGCVQHSDADGNVPYLAAVRQQGDSAGADAYEEFLIADTPTPIASRYCLPLPDVMKIVEVFVRCGGRATDILWEEI